MGRNWAIAIGINDYYNLQPLHYAVQDAASMRDFFLSPAIAFEQVYYFSDQSPPIESPRGLMRSLPTYANLKRFLRERFQQPFLEMGDNFWFFFAGHGELHEGHDYLMPIDADPGNVAETALRIGDITAYLRNCGADNVILLLDACRSQGKRSGKGFGSEEQAGMVTIYSCSPREASYEIDELQHGSFTYALLEGLHLQGVQNCATVERLDQYLRYQVPDLNQRYGKPRQTPYTAVEPVSKNHLILLPHQSTLLSDVQALKNAAYEAELEQNFLSARQLWIRVLAVSPADQQAIKAIERMARQATGTSPSPEPVSPDLSSRSTQPASVPPPPSPTPPHSSPSPSPSPSLPTFEFEVVTLEVKRSGGILGLGQKVELLTHRRPGRAEYRVEELGNGVILELVAIPGGTFQMGSPDTELDRSNDEGPQHAVTVSPFWMGKFPVTQAQWQVVADLPKVNCDLHPEPSKFKGDNRPVERVSWHEAIEFCDRLSRKTGREYRLPSEAEWEYACRSGTTTPFYFGETITTDLVNYNGNYTYAAAPKGEYRSQTTEVGSFPPNAFGLYDMHGNVWEWCLDHWHKNYQGSPTDGSAWITGGDSNYRLLRGGSWYDDPRLCRSAFRSRYPPDYRYNVIGFRVVCGSAWTL
jgi:formylglycine-generating enzyme required for sulfatase activity